MNRSNRFLALAVSAAALTGLALILPACSQTGERAQTSAAGAGKGSAWEDRPQAMAGPEATNMNNMAPSLSRSAATKAEADHEAAVRPQAMAAGAAASPGMGGTSADSKSAAMPPLSSPGMQPQSAGLRSRVTMMAKRPTMLYQQTSRANYEAQKLAAPAQNPNMYISSTYMGGTGARDRLEKLIQEGVLVDGKRVKLEAFSRSYSQTFPIPTRTALHVSADTERARIIQDGDHTYLQVGLQAIKGELPRRSPLNIALVIDRSGSMQQEDKLEHAKAAAIQLVESLRPEDTFSLTVFDDSTQLLVPAQQPHNKEAIKRKIASLNPGGGTNIYAGLQVGYREAGKFAGPDSVNRVILLSDGQVTSGVSDPQAFQRLTSAQVEREIQTTSVGLGLEFNEDLMMAIARDGKGNYHFIKDGTDTRTVFAKELNELTHVVAKAVKLRIQLADGIGLVRVLGARTLDAAETRNVKNEEKRIDRRVADELGIASNRQTDRDQPGIKLLIPDFYRGDSHIVMLELAVPRGQGQRKIADVFLKYKDLVTRTNQSEKSGVSISYTADRAEMIASINRSVKKNLLGFQTGEALADAAGLIAQGQVGNAVKRVDERMVVLGLAAKEWGDRDLDRDGQLLSRYEQVLKQLHTSPQLAQSDLGQYVARSLTYAGYKMTR